MAVAQFQLYFDNRLNWKWWGALLLFSCGFLGFLSGVGVSERPGIPESDVFTKAYYAFGLFVLGGLDLGTPTQGPLYGKVLLWIAYFGAPTLTVSAVIETLFHVLQPYSWRMRHIKNHIVIAGSGNLTFSFLKKIREQDKVRPILVIAREAEQSSLEEMQSYGNIRIVISEGNHRYLMRRLRLDRAYRILLLSDDDIVNCEAATTITNNSPALASRIVFHVADLRLLRVLQNSGVMKRCTSFNSYQMAASYLAKDQLIKRFNSTQYRDTVVLAGFGRFGQSVLEELEQHAAGAFSTVAIIDTNARRNTLIADEQAGEDKDYLRYIIEGDIDDPAVWRQLFKEVIIVNEEPVFILATGQDEQNIRAAIWLRQQYKDALIISRSLWPSAFATEVCKEHDIVNINMTELMEEGIPRQWYLD
jgi:Trk K+ transport system NAD-binding subunit